MDNGRMIELNDLWQAPIAVLAIRLAWDGYGLAKQIIIDLYIAYRTEDTDGV